MKSFENTKHESSYPCEPLMEEDSNSESEKLYDLPQGAHAKLYPGSSLSHFVVVCRMLNIKMEKNVT